MSKPHHPVNKAFQVAALAVFLTCVCPRLSSAGPRPVVRVEMETENHVGEPHTEQRYVFRPVKLTYHVGASSAEQPVSISINPQAVKEGAGLVVEHIAPDGTTTSQRLPAVDWWSSQSRMRIIKSQELPTSFSVWVLPGMHLDFSKLGIYRISYVHPWPEPDDAPETPDSRKVLSNTLTIACVTQERSGQLHRMLGQRPELASASYRFKNPPCRERPKYNRALPTIREGAERDEVLLLLGSPDWIYSPGLGEQKIHNRDETWAYVTSPVGEYNVHFLNGIVVESRASRGARNVVPSIDEDTKHEPTDTRSAKTQLGPESEAQAIEIALDFMRREYPRMGIPQNPPRASYFAEAAVDGEPLWVVGLSVPVPLESESIRRYFTQDVWIREDGSVISGPAHSP